MLHRRILVLVTVVLLTSSSLGCWTSFPVMPSAETARAIPQPAPQWKVNDYWNYSYVGMHEKFNVTVLYSASGAFDTVVCCGTSDHYENYTVRDTSDPNWYKVDYFSETWRNGTYMLYSKGSPVSGTGSYTLYSHITTDSPRKISKSNLNAEASRESVTERSNWTMTSPPSLKPENTTSKDTVTYQYPMGPVTNYRFPLELRATWPITGEIKETHDGSRNFENGGFYLWDYKDSYHYSGATGRTTESVELVKTDTLGDFEECYHINLSGNIDLHHCGYYYYSDERSETFNITQKSPFSLDRWYNNTIGNILKYNNTIDGTGITLTTYAYDEILPNAPPILETINGNAPGLSALMEVLVCEGKLETIELVVADLNAKMLNWSVVKVDGTGLMDGPLDFDHPNQTALPNDNTFKNYLNITARQPKTVSSDVYNITVNVNDGDYGGSVNFSFRVRVNNLNNGPSAAMLVPAVNVTENSFMTCTNWSMNDIFDDQDMEAGILDPLSYSAEVVSGPPLSISINDETGQVTISVPDYANIRPAAIFENNTNDSIVKYTCTDSGSGDPADRDSTTTTGVVHIKHVNHDPELSPNGTSIADNGLSWCEDTVEDRLDLNKAFFDADTRYAGDKLKFNSSGNEHIAVNEIAGYVTMVPEKDWYGKETINFTATDGSGMLKTLWVECTINNVPDAPRFCETEMAITWDNTSALTIYEAEGPNGPLNKISLAVSVTDPDEGDTYDCRWSVTDRLGVVMYNGRPPNKDLLRFACAWTGPYSSEGGPYEVKAVAIGSDGLDATYSWNLTVLNVNRPPVACIVGLPDNSTFVHGSLISFDASTSSDPDEKDITNLTFIWSSNKQGLLNQNSSQAGAQFSYNNLKPGRHLITLTVMDSEGSESTDSVYIDILAEGEQPILSLSLIIAMLIIATAAGIAVAGWFSRKKR